MTKPASHNFFLASAVINKEGTLKSKLKPEPNIVLYTGKAGSTDYEDGDWRVK